MKVTVTSMLKAATDPITTEAIALQLLAGRKLPLHDPQLRDLFIRWAGWELIQ